jgi:hypothetical protein
MRKKDPRIKRIDVTVNVDSLGGWQKGKVNVLFYGEDGLIGNEPEVRWKIDAPGFYLNTGVE